MPVASTGKAGIGVVFKMGDSGSPATFTTIANVTQISAGGVTLNTIDATHLDSPNFYQEFIAGLKSAEEWTFTLQFNPAEATHAGTTGLRAVLEAREYRLFQLNPSAIGMTVGIECRALVSRLGNIEVSPENIMTQACTLRPTGGPYEIVV